MSHFAPFANLLSLALLWVYFPVDDPGQGAHPEAEREYEHHCRSLKKYWTWQLVLDNVVTAGCSICCISAFSYHQNTSKSGKILNMMSTCGSPCEEMDHPVQRCPTGLTPEIEVFHTLFERQHTKYRKRSIKHHIQGDPSGWFIAFVDIKLNV